MKTNKLEKDFTVKLNAEVLNLLDIIYQLNSQERALKIWNAIKGEIPQWCDDNLSYLQLQLDKDNIKKHLEEQKKNTSDLEDGNIVYLFLSEGLRRTKSTTSFLARMNKENKNLCIFGAKENRNEQVERIISQEVAEILQ